MNRSFSIAVALAVLVVPAVSLAAELRVGEQPAVLTSERITGDVYLAGGSVTSSGAVTGDLVAGGGTVIISGDVGGDVLSGGGVVTILSSVADDVRVGGGNVTLRGRVGGDVIVGGGQVHIGGPGIGGDVVMGGGAVRIDAPIAGSLRMGGGNIYINAPITGAITIIDADKVTLGPKAVIMGDLSYRSGKELIREDGAEVRGEVTYEPRADRKASAVIAAGIISAWVVGKFLALLACALVVGLALRRYSREAVKKATERPLLELGRGFLVLVALPIVSVILLATVLGIPFGILGFLGFIVLMLFAWIIAPILIGSFLWSQVSGADKDVSWKTILLGVAVFELLGFVPLVGWFVQMLAILIAVGVISATKWQVLQEWR